MRLDQLFESATSQAPVGGLTHGFYRYPARFSPVFARAAIETFTEPMDTVLDPFMGGGTSAVEALALGRRFIGSDINSLSIFVTRTKTTPLSADDEAALVKWAARLSQNTNIRSWQAADDEWSDYQINTPWWIRKSIDFALVQATELENQRQQNFARSVVLKTAQWALDCKDNIPSISHFFSMLCANAKEMVKCLRVFKTQMRSAFPETVYSPSKFRRLIHCDAAELADQSLIPKEWLPPRLILTSPPYFGVHILYHRWQVRGRRETPAPFWIAASNDGMGASYYTFGARDACSMDNYLNRLRNSFKEVAGLMDRKTKLVQLVAFSDPTTELEPYLDAISDAGLKEVTSPGRDNRFWRTVPNRKWYTKLKRGVRTSKEVLLIHKRR